jgi:hypothetical protein
MLQGVTKTTDTRKLFIMSLKVSTGIPRHEVLMIDIGLQNCSDVNMIFGIPFTNRPLICQKYWSPLNCVLRFQQLANSRASSCYNYRARIMGMQCTYNTFGHAMRIQYFWTCDAHTILLDMQCTYNSFGHAMHIQQFWTCNAHTILLDMQCTYNTFGHAMHIQ